MRSNFKKQSLKADKMHPERQYWHCKMIKREGNRKIAQIKNQDSLEEKCLKQI